MISSKHLVLSTIECEESVTYVVRIFLVDSLKWTQYVYVGVYWTNQHGPHTYQRHTMGYCGFILQHHFMHV
jgi:hypothetical protein